MFEAKYPNLILRNTANTILQPTLHNERRLSFIFYPFAYQTGNNSILVENNKGSGGGDTNEMESSSTKDGLQFLQLHNQLHQNINHRNNIILSHESHGLKPSRSAVNNFINHPKGSENNFNDDLCTSLRIFLRFGRLIGVLPLNGLFNKNVCTEDLKFSRYSLASLASYLIIIILVFNLMVGLLNLFLSTKETASELAFSCAMALFYFMGLFTHIYVVRNGQHFIELFKIWKYMKKLYFSSYSEYLTDVNLFRDVNLIAGFIFTSAILENLLLFCLQSQIIWFPFDVKEKGSIMAIYYRRSHEEYRKIYNQTHTSAELYLGYFVFFSNKFALYSWNYADTMIIILSRALYYKFKTLNIVAEKQLLGSLSLSSQQSPRVGSLIVSNNHETHVNHNNNDDIDILKQQWKQLTNDHSILCKLLAEFEAFLSPIVFTCYAVNTFFICLQIKLGLTSATNTNIISSSYFIWSLLHLLGRVYMVSLTAARVNDYIHGTRKLYQSCPTHAYSVEVQRADHYLGSTSLGLTGLACFVITKPFMLTLIGVVFTLEIVLLQTVQ